MWSRSSRTYQIAFGTVEIAHLLRVPSDLNLTNYGKSLSEMWQRYTFDFISQHHFWVNTKLTDFPQYRSSLLSNILVLFLFTSVGYHTLNWHVWFPQYVCGFSCNNQLLEIWSVSVASNITRDAREDSYATPATLNAPQEKASLWYSWAVAALNAISSQSSSLESRVSHTSSCSSSQGCRGFCGWLDEPDQRISKTKDINIVYYQSSITRI